MKKNNSNKVNAQINVPTIKFTNCTYGIFNEDDAKALIKLFKRVEKMECGDRLSGDDEREYFSKNLEAISWRQSGKHTPTMYNRPHCIPEIMYQSIENYEENKCKFPFVIRTFRPNISPAFVELLEEYGIKFINIKEGSYPDIPCFQHIQKLN